MPFGLRRQQPQPEEIAKELNPAARIEDIDDLLKEVERLLKEYSEKKALQAYLKDRQAELERMRNTYIKWSEPVHER